MTQIPVPTVETKANNDSERTHTVIVDGKEIEVLRIVLFCAGNGTGTYTVQQLKKTGEWVQMGGKGFTMKQAREYIARIVWEARKKHADKDK